MWQTVSNCLVIWESYDIDSISSKTQIQITHFSKGLLPRAQFLYLILLNFFGRNQQRPITLNLKGEKNLLGKKCVAYKIKGAVLK